MFDLDRSFDKAKLKLMQNNKAIFIASVCFNLKHSWNDEVGTAGTNGIDLVIAPSYWEKLTDENRVALLMHETWHVVLEHVTRKGDRDPKLWNVAADIVIDTLLEEDGFKIADSLADTNYAGQSTEQVYEKLQQSNPDAETPKPDLDYSDGQSSKDTEDKDGKGKPTNGMPQHSQEEVEQAVKENLAKSMNIAQMSGQEQGNLPNHVFERLMELLNPKLDWRTLLHKYMNDYCQDEYSMARINRRFLPDFYLPTLHSEGMGELAVYPDASGSVSQEDFDKIITEVRSIKENLNPSKLSITPWAHFLGDTETVDRDQHLEYMTLNISGGTELRPVINHIEETKPELAIIFTDGYFNMVDYKGASDIMWVIVDNPKWTAPYGEVIHYDSKDDKR